MIIIKHIKKSKEMKKDQKYKKINEINSRPQILTNLSVSDFSKFICFI